MNLNSNCVVDAHSKGNITRFVNHACYPNCEVQKCVFGQTRLILVAKEDIKRDEELSFDYGFSWYNSKNAQDCRCGSPSCTGKIGRVVDAQKEKGKKRPADANSPIADSSLGTNFRIPKVSNASNATNASMISPLANLNKATRPTFKKSHS